MAELLNATDKRTHYCATLSAENVGERVCVMGWAQKQRDLGALIFIDLRDRTGIVQLAFDDATDREIFQKAFGVRAEFVLCAKGIVRRRGEGAVNKNLPLFDQFLYKRTRQRIDKHTETLIDSFPFKFFCYLKTKFLHNNLFILSFQRKKRQFLIFKYK